MENSKAIEDGWPKALLREYPELPEILAAAGKTEVYLVGGAVRDLLCGRGRTDLDLMTETDPAAIASRLGGERTHDRFLTATAKVGELHLDIARARAETYPHPGALPVVRPATAEEDLARRDYTINAMAVPIRATSGPDGTIEAAPLLDPFGGQADLASGTLRLLHPGSIRDDPTRILRGARYAAAYGLRPDPATEAQLRAGDLSTVSDDRVRADLIRIARDSHAIEALGLLEEWGALEFRPGWLQTVEAMSTIAGQSPWRGEADLAAAYLIAAFGPAGREIELAAVAPPKTPSAGVELARGCPSERLLIAEAKGAGWLSEYMSAWRHVTLEIGGADLLAAGIEQGPRIGRALSEVLRRKLDGEISGAEEELTTAIRLANEENGQDHDALG